MRPLQNGSPEKELVVRQWCVQQKGSNDRSQMLKAAAVLMHDLFPLANYQDLKQRS